MQWSSIIGAVCGAIIALAGALFVDARRDRARRRHDREVDRIRYSLEFSLALDTAHNSLREIAHASVPRQNRLQSANRAVHDANVFATRERLLMTGNADLVKAGEEAYTALIAIRNVIRTGTGLDSASYHDVYHSFAEAIWEFRMAARADLDQAPLAPSDLSRTSWSERENCGYCSRSA